VADVKKKIQEAQTFPAENQKLIYSGQLVSSAHVRAKLIRFTGKILNDTATVASLNIKEKDFIVCMVSKVSSIVPDKTKAKS
jgi:UV excision repair protein RAD23